MSRVSLPKLSRRLILIGFALLLAAMTTPDLQGSARPASRNVAMSAQERVSAPNPSPGVNARELPPSRRVPGSFIVRLAEGLDPNEVAHQVAADYGGEATLVYDQVVGGFAFEGPDDARGRLLRDPRVRGVDADVTIYPVGHRPELGAIRAPETWNIGGGSNPAYRGAGTVIAVLDTALEVSHPLLGDGDAVVGEDADNILDMRNCASGSVTSTSATHGTWVSGIAVGGEGVLPLAKSYYVKIGNSSATETAMVCGLNQVGKWVAEGSPISAVNISWACDCELHAVRDAMTDLRAAGVLSVVAAGNSGGPVLAPAKYESAVAVSALDQSNTTLTSWSSHGSQIDVGAPGEGISVLSDTGCCWEADGTSLAAPHVAAAAGLVHSLDPTLSPDQVVATLQQNGFVRFGLSERALNLEGSALGIDAVPTGVFVDHADGDEVSRRTTLRVAASDDKPLPASAVQIKIGGGVFETASYVAPYFEVVWDTCPADPCPADPDAPVEVQAQITDSAGHVVTTGISLVVDNNDDAPVVRWVSPTDGATVASSLDVHVSVTDDNSVSSAELFVDDVSQGARSGPTSGSDFVWSLTTRTEGSHRLRLSATDGSLSTSSTITVNVSPAIYRQGFDDQPGDADDLSQWTITGTAPLWHFTAACGAASSAPNGAYYGRDATCDYATTDANSGYLTSPWITGLPATYTLEFRSKELVESCTGCSRDLRRVLVNYGNGWVRLDERNAGTDPGDGLWHTRTYGLGSHTGKVRVRFFFRTGTAVNNNHFGWSIDDFFIKR